RCIWPASHKTACGKDSVQGRLCAEHLRRLRAFAGTWRCSWPGCELLSSTKRGMCSFHLMVAGGRGAG
ncbi:MAG: hypothetical protein ACRDJK_09645, partial [Actinomycetota bacterium]